MTVNGASAIFGIASLKIGSVSLHPWFRIELSPAFLGKPWLWQHRDYVLNMSVNGTSTTFLLASWKIQGLRGDIELSSNYRPPFYAKMLATTSPLCPNNECRRSINNFCPCILEKARVVQRHWLMVELSAACLGKNSSGKIVTLSQTERQRSLNNFRTCILDNITAMERR